jgi:hypothetical protein
MMQYTIHILVHKVQLVHSLRWKHSSTGMMCRLYLEMSERRFFHGQ